MVGTIPVRNPLGVPPEAWDLSKMKPVVRPHPKLKALHNGWFDVFEAEVEWWQEHLSDAANREALGIADKEPFRPALDQARWAIPGTISTGCCHTGHLRERARVLSDGMLLAQRSGNEAVIKVWEDIKKGYEDALPGMAGMGLREAVYDENSHIPGHLLVKPIGPAPETRCAVAMRPGNDVKSEVENIQPYKRPEGERTYVDPYWNHAAQVPFAVQCSLAVSRDWHRHRTMYPWILGIVREVLGKVTHSYGPIQIHHAYEPKTELAKEKVPELLRMSTEAHDKFMAAGDLTRAMMALPLGTLVQMSGTAGLRDAIYCLELRKNAHGANFEYKAQATEALKQLRAEVYRAGAEIGVMLNDYLGLEAVE